jgi:hypothetical protein
MKNCNTTITSDERISRNREPWRVNRRSVILAGGATLVATLFVEAVPAQEAPARVPGATAKNGGTKPVYLPESNDPVSHSVAENLFWNDILMEHAAFFSMLMPGQALAAQRGRADKFKDTFGKQFEKTRATRLDKGNYASFNSSTIEQVKQFVDYKHEMQRAQESGKLQSLVWPLFFDHTAREAERFIRRLQQLSKGDAGLDRGEVVGFWAQIMDEHAEFIAHLLDPQEDPLIEKALQSSAAFRKLRESKNASEAQSLAKSIIDFKTAAAKGIEAGKIKSIIPPTLADHVRREAVKFDDELKRA